MPLKKNWITSRKMKLELFWRLADTSVRDLALPGLTLYFWPLAFVWLQSYWVRIFGNWQNNWGYPVGGDVWNSLDGNRQRTWRQRCLTSLSAVNGSPVKRAFPLSVKLFNVSLDISGPLNSLTYSTDGICWLFSTIEYISRPEVSHSRPMTARSNIFTWQSFVASLRGGLTQSTGTTPS